MLTSLNTPELHPDARAYLIEDQEPSDEGTAFTNLQLNHKGEQYCLRASTIFLQGAGLKPGDTIWLYHSPARELFIYSKEQPATTEPLKESESIGEYLKRTEAPALPAPVPGSAASPNDATERHLLRAEHAYGRYSYAVGGLNWQGKPMPTWQELPELQQVAWLYALNGDFCLG